MRVEHQTKYVLEPCTVLSLEAGCVILRKDETYIHIGLKPSRTLVLNQSIFLLKDPARSFLVSESIRSSVYVGL